MTPQSTSSVASWENEGGRVSSAPEIETPLDPGRSLPRRMREALRTAWRARSRRTKRALVFALVAVVWILRSRAAHRAWQWRRA